MSFLSSLPRRALAPAAALALGLSALAGGAAPARAAAPAAAKPTIVFVHGAFADASGFGAVTRRLQERGYSVLSPANPLRGPASDAAYVAGVLRSVKGPIVLVGHSYGGAVISEAARGVGNVKALVYLDALALDAGESNADIAQRFPAKINDALVPRPFEGGAELTIDPAVFHAVFAADVPARIAAAMATAQRPVTLAALNEKSTEPAWKTIPSWYLVGRQDQVITPAAQRFMARRAHARTVEVDASHASYVSRPGPVADLIVRAAR
jgi:pimeloyl-ACP methyl ester carboxylesterase